MSQTRPIKIFVGPIGSGKKQMAYQLAEGKQSLLVSLAGLTSDQLKRFVDQLHIPVGTELIILKNVSDECIRELVFLIAHFAAWPSLHVILTTQTANSWEKDAMLMRRIVPYRFPRTSTDDPIRLEDTLVTLVARMMEHPGRLLEASF